MDQSRFCESLDDVMSRLKDDNRCSTKNSLVRWLKHYFVEERDFIAYYITNNNAGRPSHQYWMTQKTAQLVQSSFNLRLKSFVANSAASQVPTVMCIENQTIGFIVHALGTTYNMKRQAYCGRYRADLLLLDYKIVVECDEQGHVDRDQNYELQRDMFFVDNGFRVLRFNPHASGFQVADTIRILLEMVHGKNTDRVVFQDRSNTCSDGTCSEVISETSEFSEIISSERSTNHTDQENQTNTQDNFSIVSHDVVEDDYMAGQSATNNDAPSTSSVVCGPSSSTDVCENENANDCTTQTPKDIEDCTAPTPKDIDDYDAFIDECFEQKLGTKCVTTHIYDRYRLWSCSTDKHNRKKIKKYLEQKYTPCMVPGEDNILCEGFVGLSMKTLPVIPESDTDPYKFYKNYCVQLVTGRLTVRDMYTEFCKWKRENGSPEYELIPPEKKQLNEFFTKHFMYAILYTGQDKDGNGRLGGGYYGVCLKGKEDIGKKKKNANRKMIIQYDPTNYTIVRKFECLQDVTKELGAGASAISTAANRRLPWHGMYFTNEKLLQGDQKDLALALKWKPEV
jgi:very-short-patch-repair endonuclease